jgi:hypothetical protein
MRIDRESQRVIPTLAFCLYSVAFPLPFSSLRLRWLSAPAPACPKAAWCVAPELWLVPASAHRACRPQEPRAMGPQGCQRQEPPAMGPPAGAPMSMGA